MSGKIVTPVKRLFSAVRDERRIKLRQRTAQETGRGIGCRESVVAVELTRQGSEVVIQRSVIDGSQRIVRKT